MAKIIYFQRFAFLIEDGQQALVLQGEPRVEKASEH